MKQQRYRSNFWIFCERTIFFFSFISFLRAVPIRVLLDEKVSPNWQVRSSRGFKICSSKSGKILQSNITYHKLAITLKKGAFHINGTRFSQDELCIVPYKGGTVFNNKQVYDGSLFLKREKDRSYLINIIESESYVFSVLKTESWPGWPVEINKAFAIASRSYVLYQVLQARKNNKPFHIKNSNYHQTYSGMHGCEIIKQAVQETRGIFLSYKSEPILAMFDCCCGGVIPQKIKGVVDFKKAPYLARSYACTFCKTCKIYSWQADYSLKEFCDRLQEGVNTSIIHKIKDVKIARRDKAGVVQELIAKTPKVDLSFNAQDMYQLFREFKSYSFKVNKTGKKVTVKGRGYGHHIGMCQWGARKMVDKGWSYKDILKFYYPGTTFMQLENKKTA